MNLPTVALRQILRAVLATVALGMTASCLSAQDLNERFSDWEVVCIEPSDSGATDGTATSGRVAAPCRMIQNHALAETDETVLLVSIMFATEDKPPVAVVSVPAGVYLAPGIVISVDERQTFKLLYETCNAAGCHAGYELNRSILRAYKRGNLAVHRIFDAKRQPIDINVSLTGFTKAIDRLEELSQ